MSDREHIKSMAKEAEIYRVQGLLDQSKEKYIEILTFVENHETYSRDKKFIVSVRKKIQDVENAITEVEEAPETPDLAPEVQSLVSRLFSFSGNKESAAIEGAVALAKFGQYEKAVEEFQTLIEKGTMPLLAAKNILRTHITLSSPDDAITQFKKWLARNTFSKGDMKYLRAFLQKLLEEGLNIDRFPLEYHLLREDHTHY